MSTIYAKPEYYANHLSYFVRNGTIRTLYNSRTAPMAIKILNIMIYRIQNDNWEINKLPVKYGLN